MYAVGSDKRHVEDAFPGFLDDFGADQNVRPFPDISAERIASELSFDALFDAVKSLRDDQNVSCRDVVDDLIATGGTVEAIVKLVEKLGGTVVKICFLMELTGLRGRDRLKGYDVESAIVYEGC